MIPPALIRQKWSLLAAVALLPFTFIGVSFREQAVKAGQQYSEDKSGNQVATLPDGIYLYGNSPQPDQLARSYVIFERQDEKVVGAFYSPRSEFTCFAGEMQGTRLEVETLVPEEPQTREVKAQLASLYSLQNVSENDQRILNVCKQATISSSVLN